MNKQEFIDALRKKLSNLPSQEVEGRIAFFAEMIDDRIEDGLSEEDAVADVGAIDSIAMQIAEEIPISKIIKNNINKKKRSALETTLLIIGSPIWLALIISAFAVIFSLYASLWACVISLWAADLALVLGGPAGIVAGISVMFSGEISMGLMIFGGALVSAALGVFLFFGCKAATKGTAILTVKILSAIKHCFVRKEK